MFNFLTRINTYRERLVAVFLIAILIGSISNLDEIYAYTSDTAIHLPADYLTFRPPSPGGSYTDSIYGTAIKRISNSMNMVRADMGSGNVQTIAPEYSTMSPFNSDNSRILLLHFSYFALYDGAGNYLRNMPFEVNATAQPRWSRTDPNTFYYLRGNQLKKYNVGTNVASVVRTFSEYSSITQGGEADISVDGNYLPLAGDGRSIFLYNIATDTKGPVLDTGGRSWDSLYVTPSNNITVTWNTVGRNRYNGIELFDRNMNFVRQLTRAGGHMDITTDANRDEVLVWTNAADPQAVCPNGIEKVRLSDARQTCLFSGSWSMAYHVSAPTNNGWFFIETYIPSDPIPPSGWPAYANELLQIKLDGSEVRRLAHHRSRPFNSYTYSPKVASSWDGSRIVWGSNFGLQAISGHPSEYSDAYLIELSASAPSTPSTTPSSGGSTSGETTSGGTTTGGATAGGTTSGSTSGGASTGGTTTTGTPTTTSTVTRVENNAPSVTYSGSWFPNGASVFSAAGATSSMDAGSKATVTFNGTGLTWIGYTDEWAGIARVSVDGALKGEIDTYSTPNRAQARTYTLTGLPAGSHTLVIEATGRKNASSGGTWVWVDAFDVETASTSGTTGGSTAPTTGSTSGGTTSGTTTSTGTTGGTTTGTTSGTTSGGTTTSNGETSTGTSGGGSTSTPPTGSNFRVEQTSTAVKFSGTWQQNRNAVFSGSSAKLAMDAGSKATFTFTGTSVSWVSYRDEWSGIAQVFVDGALKGEVDAYATPYKPRAAVYSASGLNWGTHTISIVVTGRRNPASRGRWIWVDAFDYTGAALTSALTAEQLGVQAATAAPSGTSRSSSGAATLQVGHAEVAGTGGVAPSGLAIFGYRQNGVLVTEAGVPASQPVNQGRIFAEVGRSVNTGIAIANSGDTEATVSFYMTDASGAKVQEGAFTLPAHGQLAKFLNESPFNGPDGLNGTFSFNSTSPVAATALRGYTNERSEFLVTTLPIADTSQWTPATAFFPHVADGGGWRTQFILVNPTDSEISGTLYFMDQGSAGNANAMSLNIEGQARTSLNYIIPARSSRSFATMGEGSGIQTGSAMISPAESNAAPVATAVFAYSRSGVFVTMAGAQAIAGGDAFRVYAEAGEGGAIRTGLAVMNASESDQQIRFELTNLDGSSTGLTGSISVPALGQRAFFLNELQGFHSLAMPFKGILRISSSAGDIAVMGLRGHWNERSDFLVTTTPAMNESEAPTAGLVFPHFVDGGGYTTQFITFSGSPSEPASGTLRMYTQSGSSLPLGLN